MSFVVADNPPAQTPAATLPVENAKAYQAVLDQRVRSMQGSGIVVGVIDGGKTSIFTAGTSGTARPLDAHTIFEIGSVTKTFTALLLATMVLDGSVRLDDPVSKYLPASVTVPARDGKAITLLDLATQHSGLPRLPDNLDTTVNDDPYATYTVERMYAFLSSYQLPRDPGSTFEYSNFGIALLGQALANRAGMPYADLVRERVLKPLGMNDTAIVLSPEQQTRFAAGSSADGDPVKPWTFQAIAPAGALRSSVDDMLKYARCNMGQGPLGKACLFAQQPRAEFTGNAIGLVWWTGNVRHIVHHGGDTAGYHASIAIAPSRTRSVVALADGGLPVEDIALRALDVTVPVADPQPYVALDAATLGAYAGTYQDKKSGLDLTITSSGEIVKARLAGQDAARIYPSAKDAFFYRIVAATLTFTRNAGGQINAVVLHQDGAVVVFVRDGMTAPANVADSTFPPIVPVDAATLEQYVGMYASPIGSFTVTREEAQLLVRLAGQPAFPVYASAKDTFFYKVVEAQIDFVRGAGGSVTGLILHQNGQTVKADRR